MSYTQVTIPTVFTCANCGGQFIHRHSCPTMPWGNTSSPPVYIVPTFTLVAAPMKEEGT